MTPKEAHDILEIIIDLPWFSNKQHYLSHDITYSPNWAEVLSAIISARRNELQLKAIKQDRWKWEDGIATKKILDRPASVTLHLVLKVWWHEIVSNGFSQVRVQRKKHRSGRRDCSQRRQQIRAARRGLPLTPLDLFHYTNKWRGLYRGHGNDSHPAVYLVRFSQRIGVT